MLLETSLKFAQFASIGAEIMNMDHNRIIVHVDRISIYVVSCHFSLQYHV